MRILVVDDNIDAADSLSLLLELRGHVTHTVYGPDRALSRAREVLPDLVFLDIGLPDMDGYAVARTLRTFPELEGTILVALTGWGTDDDKRKARDAGFDRHLTKPIDSRVLDQVVAEIESRHVRTAKTG